MISAPAIWMVHGPTASGKTALAIALAKSIGTEIINCGARQVYRELRIGVARPGNEELTEVTHHGIASHSIHQPLTAASYAEWAEPVLREVLDRCGSAVVVGGSGLYAKALLYGLDPMPAAHPELRQSLEQRWQHHSEEMVAELWLRDPEYARTADLQNPRRVIRALELIESSGQRYSELRTGSRSRTWPVPVSEWVLDSPMPWLEARITARCNQMMAEGLREEALSLQDLAHLTPLHTVGYREFYEPGSPVHDDAAMATRIAQRTRQYAKRQRTWLAKLEGAQTIPADGAWNYLRSYVGA